MNYTEEAKASDMSSSAHLEVATTQENGLVLPLEASDSRLLRKVDLHVVPIMLATYFLQFLDKVILNYANVTGISKDLNMTGNDFTWLATAFFIAYALAEIPQGYLLQRFPLAKVLGFNVACWGITITCSSGAQSYAGFMVCRILLGCFEAVISPALTMITSQWYTKREAGPRFGLWYSGLGIGQIVGGLVSFGAQHTPTDASLGGWRIMMLAVGLVNIVVAIVVLLFLPDCVDSANFLTTSEKTAIHVKLTLDQGGNGAKVFRFSGLGEVLRDAQIWLLVLLTVLIVIPSGVVSTFSAVIIKGFGYNSKQAALLNMPSGVVSIFATMLSTYFILKGFPRWLSIILLLIPTAIGGGLMAFLDTKNLAGRLAGIYMINFIVAPLAIIFSWVGANTAGYTKRVAANSMVAMAFGVANIIGPQTFQARDAPKFIPAITTVFAVAGGAMVVSAALRLLYGHRNRNSIRKREQQMQSIATEGPMADELEDHQEMTDRQNLAFVYVY
ncbi:hypothetical protein VF21_10625 [Pseudogymnoascus sp. 05NY08]|nr:hypothetical protein VF21_10625 [Pseudogymnoascus sp. 05NY08]